MLIIKVVSFSRCHIIDCIGDLKLHNNCIGKLCRLNNLRLKEVNFSAWIEMIELHNKLN